MQTTTDRIEKEALIRAPLARVWRAISTAREFGDWFGVEFDGEFRVQTQIRGRLKPTTADSDVARNQKPFEGFPFEFFVDRIEPMNFFSFRWHPFAIDPSVDYSKEPMTLVTFTLEEAQGGTKLRIVESGFDSIPLERRATAFGADSMAWSTALELVEKYLQPAQP
jgi:uncharacterized protein YndB with AHSA1/START domain